MNGHKKGDSEPDDVISVDIPRVRRRRKVALLSSRGHDTTQIFRDPQADLDPPTVFDPPVCKPRRNTSGGLKPTQSNTSLGARKKSIRKLRDEAHGRVVFHIKAPLLVRAEEMMKAHELVIPENETLETYCQGLALQIESFVYTAFESGKLTTEYSAKVRSITFNLDNNPNLSAEILYNGISPERLATMTSEEMAPNKLKMLMEEVRNKMDTNITIVKCTGPRIRKNHKGEEWVEQVRPSRDVTEVDDSLFTPGTFPGACAEALEVGTQPGFSLSNILDKITPCAVAMTTNRGESTQVVTIDMTIDSDEDMVLCDYTDQTSSAYPVATLHEMDHNSSPLLSPPERAVRDDKANHREYSTLRESSIIQGVALGWDVYDPRPKLLPIEWMGRLEMENVTSICATAQLIGGPGDAVGRKWSELLEGILQIDTEIDARTLANFIRTLRGSSSDKIFMVSLSPTDRRDVEEIQKLYNKYQFSASYASVSKHVLGCIRGVYIFFLDTDTRIPSWFSVLRPHPDIPSSGRTARLLLVTFIVTDNRDDSPSITGGSNRSLTPGNLHHGENLRGYESWY